MFEADERLLLVVDVGNTNIVFGIFKESRIVADFRVETRAHRTADEYYVLLEPLLRRAGYQLTSVKSMVVSSVVPPALYPLEKLAQLLGVEESFRADHTSVTGIELRYHRPEEMGADRLINAAVAFQRYGACIVVDFGTATTFDVVDASGVYLGGVITPGIRISMDALFTMASRLPRVDVSRPPRVIGRSTEHAMQSGVYYGYVSMVDGLVLRITEEAGFSPEVIATGGLARLIAQDSRQIRRVEPNLTLEGLAMLYRGWTDKGEPES